MNTYEIDKKVLNPWVPIVDPEILKYLGKFIEELGECISAVARCQIQGIDEFHPVTGKHNKEWLEDEIADVKNLANLVTEYLKLDEAHIELRIMRKEALLRQWLKQRDKSQLLLFSEEE
jgi:NTP pyrophosphatase (non-canonical NTP hydrolase)